MARGKKGGGRLSERRTGEDMEDEREEISVGGRGESKGRKIRDGEEKRKGGGKE